MGLGEGGELCAIAFKLGNPLSNVVHSLEGGSEGRNGSGLPGRCGTRGDGRRNLMVLFLSPLFSFYVFLMRAVHWITILLGEDRFFLKVTLTLKKEHTTCCKNVFLLFLSPTPLREGFI